MVIKLSKWYELQSVRFKNGSDPYVFGKFIEKCLSDGYVQIIEDVPYKGEDGRGKIKVLLQQHAVTDIRFRTLEPRKEKEVLIGNAKTFREFFLGKHPECDVTILGIHGEHQNTAIVRLFDTMADYMDYIAERNA